MKPFLALPFFLICTLFAISCGGSSGGSSNKAATWGDIPESLQPQVAQKWVYTQNSYSNNSRVSLEVYETDIQTGSYKVLKMNEGIIIDDIKYTVDVIDSKSYFKTIANSSRLSSYSEPGLRAQFVQEELPFSEELDLVQLSSIFYFSFDLKLKHSFEGYENIDVGSQSLSGMKVKSEESLSHTSSGFNETQITYEWHNEEMGLIKKESLGQREIDTTLLTLQSYAGGNDPLLNFENEQISHSNEQLVLSTAGLSSSLPKALYREVYDISLAYPMLNGQIVPLTLAQSHHLFSRYYLYPSNIPDALPTSLKLGPRAEVD
ncbi:MAG: hypothetical protein HQL32_16330 [Planctomycetes bacterium]|nr:hypothetical protein [Planctomycetota bacterium]